MSIPVTALSFDRKVLTALACGAGLLAVILVLAHHSVGQVRVTSGQARATQEVRLKLDAIAETILNMESGQRGYLLTNSRAYLQPYEDGVQKLSDDLRSLQSLATDSPAQRDNVAALRELLDKRRAEMASALDLQRREGLQAALAFIATNRGHTSMEAIRALLRQMSAEEQRVLELRRAREAQSLRRNFRFSIALSVITVGLLFIIYLLVRREIAGRARTARLLDQTNATLEARVRESTKHLSEANAALMAEISQRKSAEAELQKSHELLEARVRERTAELMEATASKSRFLSAANHDLRQPLQSLVLLNAALREEPLGKLPREIVEAQQHSLESMSRLVHSLLSINVLQSGVVRSEIRDFALNELIDQLRREFAPLARSKDLQLRVDAPHATVRSDPTLLREVIQNLLANAIRYTQRGAVTLRQNRESSAIHIDVSDTGPGIPSDKLDLIFEEFRQLERPADRAREGFGLGLSIVQRLVKLLDIRLRVQSVVGAGTTFSLTVPAGEEQLTASPCETKAHVAVTAGRILLVDDEAAVRSATALFLRISGHDVVTAGSPEEALCRLRAMEQPPDVVVSDYQLGTTQTGADLVEQIRALTGPTTPAVILTGDTQRVARRCASLQDCRIFHKPVDAGELAMHLATVLERRTRTTEVAAG